MKIKLRYFFLLFFAFSIYAKSPYIIDTDMGNDDWLAINYMLAAKDISIKGISIVGTGESYCGVGVKNALFIIGIGWPWNIPVSCGGTVPLSGHHTFPYGFRRKIDDLYNIPHRNFTYGKIDYQGSVSLMYHLLKATPQKTTILAIGPLTNIANLIIQHPNIINKIKMIYIMGGAINVKGDIDTVPGADADNKVSEWNFYADPKATSIVLKSTLPIILIPLDITDKVPMTFRFYHRVKRSRASPRADLVFKIMTKLLPSIKNEHYDFWDPLAAVIATHPALATYKIMKVAIDKHNGNIYIDHLNGHLVKVAIKINQHQFENIFLNTLNEKAQKAT